MDGKEFINVIVKRLKYFRIPPHDNNILQLIGDLNKQELHQIVDLGNVVKWRNEQELEDSIASKKLEEDIEKERG